MSEVVGGMMSRSGLIVVGWRVAVRVLLFVLSAAAP